MPRTRSRHRRGIHILPLLLAAVALGIGLFVYLRSGAETPPYEHSIQGSDTSDSDEVQAPDAEDNGGSGETAPPPRPDHVTTASGIDCTLTELGDDAIYTGELLVVSNAVPFHFPEEQELVNVYDNKTTSYYVRDMEVYLAPVALEALNRMMDGFIAQGGSKTVNMVAGHRTKEVQEHLFDQSSDLNGLDHAQEYVAQPGCSEHHTGLVLDLHLFFSDGTSEDYDGTGEYAWINQHCQDYGFVVRYRGDKQAITGIADEPWHFRYVGLPHAAEMVEQDLCLEEYIDYLRGFTFEGEHLTIECGAGTYEVWYEKGTETYLPDSGEYWVSGNNIDGVIVTCKVNE